MVQKRLIWRFLKPNPSRTQRIWPYSNSAPHRGFWWLLRTPKMCAAFPRLFCLFGKICPLYDLGIPTKCKLFILFQYIDISSISWLCKVWRRIGQLMFADLLYFEHAIDSEIIPLDLLSDWREEVWENLHQELDIDPLCVGWREGNVLDYLVVECHCVWGEVSYRKGSGQWKETQKGDGYASDALEMIIDRLADLGSVFTERFIDWN